jgi:hypothetical protein
MARIDEYVARSRAGTERLKALISRLNREDYSRELDGGWTPGALLAHLAHWDAFGLRRLELWKREGYRDVPSDPDTVNAAELANWRAIPGEEAARQALANAEACDAALAGLSDEVVGHVAAAGRESLLDRSRHRDEHLAEIERGLASS